VGMYPNISQIKTALLKENYITEADSAAAETAANDGDSYVAYLVHSAVLTMPLLGQALAEYYKLPLINFSQYPATAENMAKIPQAVAQAQRVIYIGGHNKKSVVATDSPDKVDLAELRQFLGDHPIHLMYCLPEDLERKFELYQQPLDTRFSKIVETSQRIAPEIVDEIIKDGLSYQASDIHFEPRSDGVKIRFRVDGSLREAGVVPRDYYENILNRIKVESGMRIDEHLTTQDGSIQRIINDRQVDLRVSLVPTVDGEKVAIRVLGAYVAGFSFDDLGMSDSHRAIVERCLLKPFGMILTVGPTGSGKTTTLYSLLKRLNRPDVNITTIEDPVEYKIAGINQIQVREASNMTFAKGLRSIVRQDPDIILVGEIRDRETAEISVNAALTGHLLLSTFHANDASTALPRLIDMGIEPFLLASTLEAVIAQRLVRTICTSCRYGLSPKDAVAALNIEGCLQQYRLQGTFALV
jgi:type IV pilus assembly protein PilB